MLAGLFRRALKPSFCGGVRHVVAMGSKPKMRWVYAVWIVA
jgi:hypothetical protein